MSQSTPIPEWLLERYLVDELSRRERRRVEAELERDPALRAELARLRQSGERILAEYPAERMVPAILERAAQEAPARPRLRPLWVAVPALAAALLLLVLLPPILRQRQAEGPYTGIKGGAGAPELQVFRRGGGEPLRDGARVRAGDLLQLAYLPGQETHGVILSIDGAGGVTLHFPERQDGDTALPRGRRTLLPRAFELDRAPRFERFILVTAREPLPTAKILEAARALAAGGSAWGGKLDLPGRFRQSGLLLRK